MGLREARPCRPPRPTPTPTHVPRRLPRPPPAPTCRSRRAVSQGSSGEATERMMGRVSHDAIASKTAQLPARRPLPAPPPLPGTGAVTHLSCIVALLLWKPSPDQLAVFFVFAGLWGVADAVWQTQNNGECPASSTEPFAAQSPPPGQPRGTRGGRGPASLGAARPAPGEEGGGGQRAGAPASSWARGVFSQHLSEP